jgi:hypothetical protein
MAIKMLERMVGLCDTMFLKRGEVEVIDVDDEVEGGEKKKVSKRYIKAPRKTHDIPLSSSRITSDISFRSTGMLVTVTF